MRNDKVLRGHFRPRNGPAQAALKVGGQITEVMTMQRFGRSQCLFLALGTAILGAGAGLVEAKTPFDGPWAVTIMTESGTCDPAYRYAVVVADGKVTADFNESSGTINISGKIDAGGRVSVNVGRGDQRADATGKLSQSSGSGTWTGKTSQAACAGRWEAKRN
jgi:hypothetical protein